MHSSWLLRWLLNVADVNEMTYPVEQFDILTESYFGKKDMPAGEYKDYRADVFKAANEKGNELTRELVEQIPEGITYTVTTKIGTPGPFLLRHRQRQPVRHASCRMPGNNC